MEWLFSHLEDPDIDEPIQLNSSAGASSVSEPSADQVTLLVDMGFTHAQARKALLETVTGSTDTATTKQQAALSGSAALPAIYRLKAFISHKDPSVHSGHYVTHIRLPRPRAGEAIEVDGGVNGNEAWVLFDDEKVVLADRASVEELKKLAYMYVYERIPSV